VPSKVAKAGEVGVGVGDGPPEGLAFGAARWRPRGSGLGVGVGGGPTVGGTAFGVLAGGSGTGEPGLA